MKLIEITVSPTGETTIRTQGYSGTECLDATRSLEAALGVKTVEQHTAELYQQAPTLTQETQQ